MHLRFHGPGPEHWHASHVATHLGYLGAVSVGAKEAAALCAAILIAVWLCHALCERSLPHL